MQNNWHAGIDFLSISVYYISNDLIDYLGAIQFQLIVCAFFVAMTAGAFFKSGKSSGALLHTA